MPQYVHTAVLPFRDGRVDLTRVTPQIAHAGFPAALAFAA